MIDALDCLRGEFHQPGRRLQRILPGAKARIGRVDWANRNDQAALRHALKLPAGPERSSLMMWALTAYAYDDAPAAASWCEALPDGKEKQDALGTVVGNWTETSPQAAANYLSGKPADATARVLETVAGAWSQLHL